MNQDDSRRFSGQGLRELPFTTSKEGSTEPASLLDAGASEHLSLTEPQGFSFGDHLRSTREEQGLALTECAHALHLPVCLLQKLESDDYKGIDYPVYLRSYLDKYAAHIGLDRHIVDAQLERLQVQQPELTTTRKVSAWQHTFNRYSSAATYIVLTAVIVVPLIWLGLSGVLTRDIAKLAPLDTAPVNVQSAMLADTTDAAMVTPSPLTDTTSSAASKPVTSPLMASMAPFSAMESIKLVAPAITVTNPVDVNDATQLTLQLQKSSWVEITDATGKRLEYGLLSAGTNKVYDSNHALDVRIGNAEGVSVSVDGKQLALGPFRRANVAHFNITGNGDVQANNN